MTKPFAQWSEAEVVEYMGDHVRETWPLDVTSDADLEPPRRLRGNGIPADVFVALWFRAAWEWLKKGPPPVDTLADPRCRHGLWGVEYHINMRSGLPERQDLGPLPSSVHAIAAACLLAAGKAVPE